MQFYDMLMLAVMAFAILFGFWKGFAWQVASLSAILVSYFVARNFNEPVAEMIGGDPSWNRFLAMFILFMGTSLVIWLGFGFVKNSIEKLHLKTFDRQVGAVLGAAKGSILAILVTLFSVSLLGEQACRVICTSRSGNYIAHVIGRLGNVIPPEIAVPLEPYVERFHKEIQDHQNENPGSNQDQFNGGFSLPIGGQANPNMTQFDPANQGFQTDNFPSVGERLGQLQPGTGGTSTQPAFNGTFSRNQVPAQPASTGNFNLQDLPNQLGNAAGEAIREGLKNTVENEWRRAWGGNQ